MPEENLPIDRRVAAIKSYDDLYKEPTRDRDRIIRGAAVRLCVIADSVEALVKDGRQPPPKWLGDQMEDLRKIAANLMDLD